jgi:outer membrane lipoprotein-sorting protein
LGTENNLTKYRVRMGDAENPNSEILIYVDEQIKLPVRQEFYSTSGEQKTLTFAVELKNFKTEADEKLFEVPKDFRKITPKEFQEVLRQERNK